jgi:hypothetical protein
MNKLTTDDTKVRERTDRKKEDVSTSQTRPLRSSVFSAFSLPTAFYLLGASALLAASLPAHAEIIELIDKTKMTAKIVHYYDGVYTVEAQGQPVKMPKEKIKSITFQMPAPRPEFSTPEKTFERWRKALGEGNL